MKKPITAYQGKEPYVFVCYSHTDSDSVYADLEELDSNGIRLWYDEGIAAGSSWRASIAQAIQGAKKFIFFISRKSLDSTHCLREVDYALSQEIEIIPVYLEDCPLPAELDLVLNRLHALFKEKDAKYEEHLLGALKKNRPISRPSLKERKQRKPGIRLPMVLGVVAVLVLITLLYWDKSPFSEPASTGTNTSSNANVLYLDGLELMKRWDKENNLEIAIGLFREATNADPEFALAYARLAGALRMQYAITGQDAWLDEAVLKVNEAKQLSPGLAPVQVALGRIHAAQGNNDLAFAALERALSIDPLNAEANQAIAKVYERQGRLQDAEASFQKALALDPENLLIRSSYASFLSRQGRNDEAVQQLQAVIDVAPDHFGALVNMGAALSELNRTSEAIVMYEQAIDIRPSYMGYSNLGTAYSREQSYPKAVSAFKQALEYDDSDWLAWGNLAYVYSWMNGMESQAIETFDHAIELAEASRQQNPRDPYVYSDLALYYAKQEQAELALERLETAVTLSPDSAEILAAAAEAYELIGQREKAIELVQESVRLGYPVQSLQGNPEFAQLLADQRMQDSL